MGKTLEQLVTTKHVAEVVHHGEKLIVPSKMEIDDAIDLLKRRREYLHTWVDISEVFNVFPWDGAYALAQVLSQRYGWAQGRSVDMGWFGEQKPQIINLPVGPNERAEVPWGQFEIAGIQGYVETGYDRKQNGAIVFKLNAQIKRQDEDNLRELFQDVRDYLTSNSLYRGKAMKMRFRHKNGKRIPMPEPEFLDVSRVDQGQLILNRDLQASVEANLFTPIERVEDCFKNGIRVKRGVLLGGDYGTGKTLAATVAAKIAQDNGITFVYCARANELGDAIDFARQYQSPACVVFCEDIDRTTNGQRTVAMDDLLNILDGVDTKSDNILTVMTTNHLENINKAMLRPGRLDAIINVERPDAEAARRLVRMYGGDAIPEHEDLTEVGETLKGQIPAVIEEAVKRAKLYQLSLSSKGESVVGLTAEALLMSAKTMATQIELLKENASEPVPTLDKALGSVVGGAVERAIAEYHGDYDEMEAAG